MVKEFLPFDVVRNNALKLACKIYHDGFIPDVIYVSLRGGAYMGNVISEYFKIVRKGLRPCYYAAVVARSYTDVRASSDKVSVDGWTYSPEHLRCGDKILLVDDIFDSGRTVNHLTDIILQKGIPRDDIKIAVHDYKYFYDKPKQLPIQPDYWARRQDLSIHEEARWIHYMSHELTGLTKKELQENYYKDDPQLENALSIIKSG
ncbi:MAG: phosphoribosyltransferase family protein [Termitinemataceae bacterium]|nr:MAG: phosphoribosyltransferase family protein [Termitinemataceae bacterium]